MIARRLLSLTVLSLALLVPAAAHAAAPAPQPYGTNSAKGFRNILPPGTNGLDNAAELAAFEASGARPAHNDDQLGMYANLIKVAPHLTTAQIPQYFKDATFGVPAGQAAKTESPCPDVTIVRDKAFGVPHIYGSTRAGLMCGIGYATAEDRLFFIDVLRHVGRAELSSFAGGAPGNRAMDAAQWAVAPYTESDLQKMVDIGHQYGAEGEQLFQDGTNYIAGINKYIQQAKLNPALMPGEYAAIGKPLGPDPFKVTDITAIASLVGGIFGRGGGNELPWAQYFQSLETRLGNKGGAQAFKDFRDPDDPEAPTTVHKKRFPYRTHPKKARKGSVALPDRGSVKPFVTAKPLGGSNGSGGGSGGTGGGIPIPTPPLPIVGQLAKAASSQQGLLQFPRSESNALLVSARKSKGGHPIAVFGPQVGYFAPQILMEEDIHGPGIDADGAAFPGTNVYVQLGHGRDYAWSATSSGQDITDTYAVPLCDPNGGKATLSSTGYRYGGKCLAIQELDRTNSWTPNAADQTPAGTETLKAQRTVLGLVTARATIKGKPVIYTQLRSTYYHELDSALGFADYNNPAKMQTPAGFRKAAHKIGYTFNWFYINRKHIAYFNSGANPVRPKGLNPFFPVTGRAPFLWKGFNATSSTEQQTPASQHPQVTDQEYLTSWNNKQAKGYAAPDTDTPYTSIYRSQLLDSRLVKTIKGKKKATPAAVINDMEDAGTADLRGSRVLPYLLKVVGKPKSAAGKNAVAALKAWQHSGSHRIDRNGDGTYDQATAVRIMDAWWPLVAADVFKPTLGNTAYTQLLDVDSSDNTPQGNGDHLGSAWDVGFYGTVQKDLRAVLGKKVKGKLSRLYCGTGPKAPRTKKGKRRALVHCRARLKKSLLAAAAEPITKVYPGDDKCKAGDQTCWDEISLRALGAVTQPLIPWVNRPTFQQVVQLTG